MTNLWAIARKELGIFFTTTIAYAGFGAYAFLMGMVFVSQLNRYQQATSIYLSRQRPDLLEQLNFNDSILTPMFSSGIWMFLFFVPLLTMRSFAEEKSQNTFELLMTCPITSWQLVLGKFVATASMIVVMALIPVVFPVILSIYGTSSGVSVEWNPVWSALLCLSLMGITFAALGLLASAATETQLLAALVTFALLLLGYVMPFLAARVEGDWSEILTYVSPVSHVTRGLQGRLLVEDLVYFVSVSAGLLVWTQRIVESHRWR